MNKLTVESIDIIIHDGDGTRLYFFDWRMFGVDDELLVGIVVYDIYIHIYISICIYIYIYLIIYLFSDGIEEFWMCVIVCRV